MTAIRITTTPRAVLLSVLGLLCFQGAARSEGTGKDAFDKANKYFQAGEYEAALPFFQKAYDLSNHRPSTIRALAQCERALKLHDPAIEHFKEYLASAPKPADTAAIEETIALLEDLRTQARATAAAEAKEREKKEAEARATQETEAKEREKKEAESRAEQKRLEEATRMAESAAHAAEAAAQAARVTQTPNTATAPAPLQKDAGGGILSSPAFWIATAVVVVGGGVAAGFLLTRDGDPVGGNTGVLLRRLEAR